MMHSLQERPLPVLADYDISPQLGFLSSSTPLNTLHDPYYEDWEYIGRNLQSLLLSKRLRTLVNNLEVLSCDRLTTLSELRRAYSLLAFISHAYIWGESCAAEVVPPPLSSPFKTLCTVLEIPTVATYAAVVLWNFQPIFQDEPYDRLENLATIMTFTGSLDESWFYLVSVVIEGRGGFLVSVMLQAMQKARENDSIAVARCLSAFTVRVGELGELLGRIYEQCDPYVFYNQIRAYLSGSRNMADRGLPNGVTFDDGSGFAEPVELAGGSNGQSSLIQFFDIALGVQHHQSTLDFAEDMRQYMPAMHRRFLAHVIEVANIRGYVESQPMNDQLLSAFSSSLIALTKLRNKHMEIVSRYIIVMHNRQDGRYSGATRTANETIRNHASSTVLDKDRGQANDDRPVGTGGTQLVSLLKQMRDETVDCARLLN